MARGKAPRRGSIRARVIGLALAFTLIASVIITVNTLLTLIENLERSTLQSAEYALQTAAASIKQDVDEIDGLADWCVYNSTVRTYILTDVTSQTLIQTVYPTVSGKYNALRTQAYIQRFLIVNDRGRMMMFGSNLGQSYAIEPESVRLLPGLGSGEEDIAWLGLYKDPLMLSTMATTGIPITRTITLPGGSHTARVYIAVSPAMITSSLEEFTLAEGGRLYWKMGGQFYSISGQQMTLTAPVEASYTPYLTDTLDAKTSVYTTYLNGERYLAVLYPVGAHGMELIELIPYGPIRRQVPLMLGSLGVSLLTILALGIVLMFLLRQVVTHPINALQKRIDTISRGDFSTDPAIEWDHELGDVGRGINRLARSVTVLMDQRVEDEKQKQDLEYRMLQNQINPHFIYNTLNSIKWMATIQHAPGIAEMVTALSRLMKSVSKGNERLVPLYEEFALLNDYFTIQQYRYGGTITLEVTYIESEALTHSCLIPRFTLQPLVENAIFHGIEPKGCAGDIALTVAREPDSGDVLLRLTDNGVGMTAEQAAKALSKPGPEEEAAKFRHVGLWNVHRRLQYNFGDRYGLAIESVPGEGTTVVIRLPGPQEGKEKEV